MDNLKKREEAERRRTESRVMLAEAKAGRGGVEEAKGRMKKAELDYEIMDGLVKRQESIKGFVRKENRGVEKKRARIAELEGVLEGMSV